MNPHQRRRIHLACAASAVLLVAVAWLLLGDDDRRGPPIPRPNGPDLQAIFAKNPDAADARKDAQEFGDVCQAVVEALKYEWGKETAEPIIKTGHQMALFRRKVYDNVLQGRRLGQKYPAFADAVEGYLDQVAGKKSGALNDEQKAAWLKAYQTLADCGYYAGKEE